jgi:putative colanic acid biosynthesis UDP-glucose lipid carrier transferase
MNFMNHNERSSKYVTVDEVDEAPLNSAKWRMSYRLIEPAAMALDAIVILTAYFASEFFYLFFGVGPVSDNHITGAIAVAALFIALAKSLQLYRPSKLLVFSTQIRSAVLIWMSVLFFCAAIIFAWKVGEQFSRGLSVMFCGFGLTALCAVRIFWRIFIDHGLSEGKFGGRAAILIGESTLSEPELYNQLIKHGYKIDRQFVLPDGTRNSPRRDEIISKAINYVRGSEVSEIIVGADLTHWRELKPILHALRVLPVPVRLMPCGISSELFSLPSNKIGNSPYIELQREPLSATERLIKRGFDVACATTCLILLFPLLVMIAVAIKIDSNGPILFLQRRCGFNGKQFRIFKFRTMNVLEDGPSIVPASPYDRRVTSIGRWLRRTSLDELPQLLNVLIGNMSIVGPRPHAVAHDDQFQKIVRNYAFRHHVKPGITGWAQVNKYRGQITTCVEMERRLELDIWYVNNWSITLDLWIVFRTAFEVMGGDNAY